VTTAAVTPEHYDKTFNINARGVFFTVQKALPLMKDGGSIILNGSVVWQKGFPIYATYSGTKAALRSFVRTWAAEFASQVNPRERGQPRPYRDTYS
jgi:NAD(P)-dependent dehydrogenase (short-subunit alcohol dehydrogenase family)